MTEALRSTLRARLACGLAAGAAVAILAGCVTEPPPRPYRAPPPPPPPERPSTDVFAYPQQGQTTEQQDRDRYECSLWARQQTGFDPSAANVPPHDRVRVVPAGPPPGTGTAIGAVTGAILGAAIGGPRNWGAGAVVGGVAGGALGSASDAANAQQQQAVAAASVDRRQGAWYEQQASKYRRAISACLEGRGYSVR